MTSMVPLGLADWATPEIEIFELQPPAGSRLAGPAIGRPAGRARILREILGISSKIDGNPSKIDVNLMKSNEIPRFPAKATGLGGPHF